MLPEYDPFPPPPPGDPPSPRAPSPALEHDESEPPPKAAGAEPSEAKSAVPSEAKGDGAPGFGSAAVRGPGTLKRMMTMGNAFSAASFLSVEATKAQKAAAEAATVREQLAEMGRVRKVAEEAAGAPSAGALTDQQSRRDATLALRKSETQLMELLSGLRASAAKEIAGSEASTRPGTAADTGEERRRREAAEQEAERLRDEIEVLNAKIDSLQKLLEGFNPEDISAVPELLALRNEVERLRRENAQLRRSLAVVTPGFHGEQLPWSPRLQASASAAITYPRLPRSPAGRPATSDGSVQHAASAASAAHADALADPLAPPLATPATALGSADEDGAAKTNGLATARGATQRMRDEDAKRQRKWEAKRAQLEANRSMEVEATMRAFAAVHYTGEVSLP